MSRGKNMRSWLVSECKPPAGDVVCALPRTAMSTGNARIHASFFIITPPEFCFQSCRKRLRRQFPSCNCRNQLSSHAGAHGCKERNIVTCLNHGQVVALWLLVGRPVPLCNWV